MMFRQKMDQFRSLQQEGAKVKSYFIFSLLLIDVSRQITASLIKPQLSGGRSIKELYAVTTAELLPDELLKEEDREEILVTLLWKYTQT